jgi:hypothetical protein
MTDELVTEQADDDAEVTTEVGTPLTAEEDIDTADDDGGGSDLPVEDDDDADDDPVIDYDEPLPDDTRDGDIGETEDDEE